MDKFKDSRRDALHMLAGRRLKLQRRGKKWVICYAGRGSVSGLVPDFMPIPHQSKLELDPESISAQIRGALVDFAFEALNDKRFQQAR